MTINPYFLSFAARILLGASSATLRAQEKFLSA